MKLRNSLVPVLMTLLCAGLAHAGPWNVDLVIKAPGTVADLSRDGKWIASAGSEEKTALFDTSSGKKLFELNGCNRDASKSTAVTFSNDASLVATVECGGVGLIYETSTQKVIQDYSPNYSFARGIAVSPDNRLFAVVDENDQITLLDVKMGTVLRTFGPQNPDSHYSFNPSLAFSPDGSALLNITADGKVTLWNVTTGEAQKTLSAEGHQASSATFNSDGSLVAAGTREGAILLWNVSTGDLSKTLKGTATILTVNFSGDSHRLVSGASDGSTTVWDLESGAASMVSPAREHADPIGYAQFTPDGRVVTAEWNKGFKFWKP
jgi:WD40 repeat protein